MTGSRTVTHDTDAARPLHNLPARTERWFLIAMQAALVLWFIRVGLSQVSDPDAWLHLRLGTFLNDGGTFQSLPDPWSSQAERVYVPTQWLPQRVGAHIFEIGGLPAVALMRTAAALGLLLALYWMCRQIADAMPATVAAAAGFLGSAGAVAERPQAAALVLLTVVVGGWWMTIRDTRARWWIIGATWLLALIHGLWSIAIVVGVLFVCVAILDCPADWRNRARLFLIPGLSCVAAALTPLGARLLLTPLQVGGAAGTYVQEWQPVRTTNPLFVIALVILVIVGAIWTWGGRSFPPSRGLLVIAALVCIMWSGRTIAVGVILAVGLLAEALQSLRGHPATHRWSSFEKALWAATCVAIIATATAMAPSVASEPASVPTSLKQDVRSLESGAIVLAAHELSGWLMWEAPQADVVLDLRSEIYSEEQIEEYLDAVAAVPGWEEYVDRMQATHALLADDSPLAEALARVGWTELDRGQGYVLLVGQSR